MLRTKASGMLTTGVEAITVVDAVAALLAVLGSGVPVLAVDVLERIVLFARSHAALTTRVKICEPALVLNAAIVAVIVPRAPCSGEVIFQPVGAIKDWNVVPAGKISISTIFSASSGPLLITV